MFVLHEVACSNFTEIKYSNPWATGGFANVNFRNPKLVQVSAPEISSSERKSVYKKTVC